MRFDIQNFPLFPFRLLFLHSEATNGGEFLDVYFFVVCFMHFGIYYMSTLLNQMADLFSI